MLVIELKSSSDHVMSIKGLYPLLVIAATSTLHGEDLSSLEQAKLTWWFFAFQRVSESHLLQWKQGLSEDLETPICVLMRLYARRDFFRNILIATIENEGQTATTG